MAIVDPVADMLTRIRNAHQAYHRQVEIPASKMKVSIAFILKNEGYIEDFSMEGETIRVALKYVDGKPLIAGLKKVSKPGRRVYIGATDIPRVQNGLGTCIVSTSRGLMSGSKAAEGNLGGELICEIW
jgi:small subunit ribosomal protein S8